VRNPERGDGCTLMDAIWNAEPFADHAAFVARVTEATADFMAAGLLSPAERDAVRAAAAQSEVGGPTDHQLDNSCQNRIAFTFDDGTSGYRPATLQVLRDKQVHANFFDNGFRVAANPQWARFQVREGHIELNHTYSHIHMDEMSDAGNREEVLRNEALLASIGAPLTFKGIRPPFGGSDAGVQATLSSMGYTYFLNRIDAADWLPDKSAEAIRDDILRQLRPGVIVALHDGPVDTPAGAATVAALGMIIDRAREQGYCFGVIDHTGMVVADRYVSSGEPIPPIVNPIPYHALAFGTTEQIPQPFVYDLGPLTITATHSPSLLVRGGFGTLTLTVTNDGDAPTDGETVIVTDAIPAGLTATSASGTGWTCTGSATRRCTRTDVLAPHASYPPIAIAVNASATAPGVIANRATVLGHGEVWNRTATDTFSVGVPASGDVSGTVPATLALSLGAPASFGAFTPGTDREYTATTTANVISTAGDAALSVSDPGHLANGTFALPEALRVEVAPASWTGPVSNAAVAITFRQHIGAGDALRTGSYSKTLTFTLSTQTP
jgi:uncharacterized repeat protein (TIGR01451 family)